jgi:hypothetical protein
MFAVSTLLPDNLTIHEFELVVGMKICLKTFPFDAKRKSLGLQPLKETPMGKAPPTARATTALKQVRSEVKLPPMPVVVRKSSQKPKKRPGAPPLIKLSRPLTQNRPVAFQSDSRLALVARATF